MSGTIKQTDLLKKRARQRAINDVLIWLACDDYDEENIMQRFKKKFILGDKLRRHILFYAQTVYNGAWIYGYYLGEFDSKLGYSKILNIGTKKEEVVFSGTVVQSTGKHDKHGRYIFEGSIVKADDVVGFVEWQEERCVFLVISCDDKWFYLDEREWEVVGNIYILDDIMLTREVDNKNEM